ncbi:metal-dependent hydrolase [Natrinema halophilum]|uniref:metal-dependent hydrolase n=1 Tax=Natrinema halophilum TaxID=1699371 RepID=UPI001F1FDB8A|nr:metal-dependent hydrolase [Natrinema halophilum]UHQ96141.1 metal-dependent hydrolase [Natrinema halophilum]
MWPWGHLAVGYLLYSISTHALLRRPPTGRGAIALAVATQFPDLVDKPLAWTLAIIPGRSLGHSFFFVGPLLLVGMMIAGRYGQPEVGAAWVIGYLSHLFTDVFSPLSILEMDVSLGFLFWPLVPVPMTTHGGFLETILYYLNESIAYIFTPIGVLFVISQIVPLFVMMVVWIYDGCPGKDVITNRLSSGHSG